MSDGRAQRPAEVALAPSRHPSPPAGDPGVPALVEAIRAEIAEGGPVTFARFMQRALYEPGLGYYVRSLHRPTRGGDFLTAPELHPLFGRALARQVHEVWQLLGQPDDFVLREYGAGSGTLALALLGEIAAISPPLYRRLRYQPLEIGGGGAEPLRRRLSGAGIDVAVDEPSAGDRFVGCVLANEFLDALAVHRVVGRKGGLRELYVDWADGRFVEVEGPPSTADLARPFEESGIELSEGQRAEVNLQLPEWLAQLAAELERGCIVVIDYGAEPAQLYGPRRVTGTLRAFRGHHVSSEVLDGVGEQDLTAHVDLGALRRAARASGLDVLGTTTQAEFLVGCGLEELLAAESASLPDEWQPRLLLRSAVRRLLDPRQLGGYAVVLLGRGMPAERTPRGLSFRLPARG